MTSKLVIYNKALRFLGERKLASLSENREPRRVLDDIWDAGTIDYCLEQGQWTFATRTISLTYDSSISPTFGFQRVFELPSDHIRTTALSGDQFFYEPLLNYYEGGGLLYAMLDTLYVKYVSNDAAYGNDMSLWPQTFINFMAAYMAYESGDRITQSEAKILRVEKMLKEYRTEAKSNSAMEDPSKRPAPGSWNNSRWGRWGSYRRQNPPQLIG